MTQVAQSQFNNVCLQSKPDSKSSDYGTKDDRKPSLPNYPNEKDENVGETSPEVKDA